MEEKDARDLVPGFYESPKTKLTRVATEALAHIYRELGFDLETDTHSNVRAAIFIMQLNGDDTPSSLGEEVGAAFAGFEHPHHMIEHVLAELSNMASKLGIPMTVEVVDGPASFSQN